MSAARSGRTGAGALPLLWRMKLVGRARVVARALAIIIDVLVELALHGGVQTANPGHARVRTRTVRKF